MKNPKTHKNAIQAKTGKIFLGLVLCFSLVSGILHAAQDFYFRDTTASEPLPPGDQGGYPNVHGNSQSGFKDMTPTQGSSNLTISIRPGTDSSITTDYEYLIFHRWATPALAGQTLSSSLTFTIQAGMEAEGDTDKKLLSVYIYVWQVDDTLGDILCTFPLIDTSNIPDSPSLKNVTTSPASDVTINEGDRIIVEMSMVNCTTGNCGSAYEKCIKLSGQDDYIIHYNNT